MTAAGDATRDRILKTAATLFGTRGATQTGLADVAQQLGTTRQAILHHFPSKKKLVSAVLRRYCSDDLVAACTRLPADGGFAALFTLTGTARYVQRHPTAASLPLALLGENFSPDDDENAFFRSTYDQARTAVTALLDGSVAKGEIGPDVDTGSVAVAVVSVLKGTQLQWVIAPDSIDLVAAIERYVTRLGAELGVAASAQRPGARSG
jgi:AcrR family transcriptional regulator